MGIWRYTASFRHRDASAESLTRATGAAHSFNGAGGELAVLPKKRRASGLLRDGPLQSVGEHDLKARDGNMSMRTTTNGPEHSKAFAGFGGGRDNGEQAWFTATTRIERTGVSAFRISELTARASIQARSSARSATSALKAGTPCLRSR